jgi:hypothetical protein
MVARVPVHLASVEEEGQVPAPTDHPASYQSSWLRLLRNG